MNIRWQLFDDLFQFRSVAPYRSSCRRWSTIIPEIARTDTTFRGRTSIHSCKPLTPNGLVHSRETTVLQHRSSSSNRLSFDIRSAKGIHCNCTSLIQLSIDPSIRKKNDTSYLLISRGKTQKTSAARVQIRTSPNNESGKIPNADKAVRVSKSSDRKQKTDILSMFVSICITVCCLALLFSIVSL